MDSSIKTLTITGAAASSGSEAKKPRRGISRRKKVDDEDDMGDSLEVPIKQLQIQKTSAPLVPLAPSVPSVPSVPSAPLVNLMPQVKLPHATRTQAMHKMQPQVQAQTQAQTKTTQDDQNEVDMISWPQTWQLAGATICKN